MISGSNDNKIMIWYDYETLLHELNEHKGGINEICQITEVIFASSSSDNTIKIWDKKAMNCIKTIKSKSDNLKEIFPVIYHSSGKLIYSNSDSINVLEYNIENKDEDKDEDKDKHEVIKEKINLTFKTSTGYSTTINTDYIKTIKEIILEYLRQMGQSELFDKNNFKFMFNGNALNINSTEKIEDYIKMNNNMTQITVFDSNNLLKPQQDLTIH